MRIRSILTSLMIPTVILLSGCERTTPTAEETEACKKVTTEYLHALAEAYSSLSVDPIKELATPREIEDVRRLLRGLAGTGDRIEAKLLSVEFSQITVFRNINATVSTTEVWDVIRYDAGTGREKGRNPASVQTSILQLRLIDGQWKVLARRVMETQGKSKWKIDSGPMGEPTPEPTPGESPEDSS